MTPNENSLPFLLQQRAALLDQAQEIIDSALAEGRALKSGEFARVTELRKQAEQFSAQISAKREANRRELSLPRKY